MEEGRRGDGERDEDREWAEESVRYLQSLMSDAAPG
jgi:hypothetical protein